MSSAAFALEVPPPLVLEPTGQAPGLARRCLAEWFAEWGIEDDHAGRLVVCELVTNSYLHGKGQIVVRVFRDERDGRPVVEVWDAGEAQPEVQPEDGGALSGRGLMLVAELVHDWGVRPLNEGGKVVWATLR
ncbi:ATP-binding protein [Actinomadura soli]|uniref:ATP-binding protein n=1 Tax=Actinomadura soli TaxID=2508997 RepID=A0A5C4J7G2_9ACTN|nr:ATP-binding protein [Actinomadura soli]TMQ94741.1 ATP-binding protein [Actinomadura soli]